MCAPNSWEAKTGEPAEDAGPVPEHLMLRLTDERQEIKKEELLAMIKPVYIKSYLLPAENFTSEKAYENSESMVLGYLQKLKADIADSKDDNFFLLSAQEREQKKLQAKTGKKEFIEIKN